jgi:protein-S-isoprenylcysteine O-methyltransferase Ste14
MRGAEAGSGAPRARAIAASYAGVLLYSGLVFVGAWKLNYWRGLTYVALALVGTTLSHLLMPADSDLAERRVREASSGQVWDKQLLGVLSVVNMAMFVVAGMDSGRFMWSGPVPLWATIAGAVLMLGGQVIFAIARRENAFFSSTVRVQTERGHQVCESGLYRLVRHPGYLGMLLSIAAFPLLMGSYWAFAPGAIAVAVLVVRTVLEDRFLLSALPGYMDYAARTKFRLIPAVF